MEFDQTELYFDEPLAPEVEILMSEAGRCYSEGTAENYLLRAYKLAPEQLVVLVAIYRYYFYQHRLGEALEVAENILNLVQRRLAFPVSWHQLHSFHIEGVKHPTLGLLRFYLLVLKASAYLYLRLGHHQEGQTRLTKLVELDHYNRLGGQTLLKSMTEDEETY